MNDRRDLITGLTLGALIGVGLGILFAPATGEETRERLRR
jgi:gas vesicle protein